MDKDLGVMILGSLYALGLASLVEGLQGIRPLSPLGFLVFGVLLLVGAIVLYVKWAAEWLKSKHPTEVSSSDKGAKSD